MMDPQEFKIALKKTIAFVKKPLLEPKELLDISLRKIHFGLLSD